MKVLIVGNAYSQYNVAFADYLKRYDKTVEVDIVNITLVTTSEAVAENWSYNNVYHYQVLNSILQKIPKIRSLVLAFKEAKFITRLNQRINTYDVICIQGFWYQAVEIFEKLNSKAIFTVGAVWGSDFYQKKKWRQKVFDLMDQCDRLIIATDEVIKDIQQEHPLPISKIRKCLFGLLPLEKLIEMKDVSRQEAKLKVGIDPHLLVITCGYNGRDSQQHLQIIDEVLKIRSFLSLPFILIFPMTYSVERNYKEVVRGKLISNNLNFKILENFMTVDEVALLRIATDIFIQVQKTDAFSGSMQEHLFAKSVVITGKWLPYQSLDKAGVYYETIDQIDKLGEQLLLVLKKFDVLQEKAKNINGYEKFANSRWPICIRSWHDTLCENKNITSI